MDKASVFGTEDCRFESYRGQYLHVWLNVRDVPLALRKVKEKNQNGTPTVGLEPTTTRLRALRSTN